MAKPCFLAIVKVYVVQVVAGEALAGDLIKRFDCVDQSCARER